MHFPSTRTGYGLYTQTTCRFFPLEILGANITTSIQRPPVLCDLFSELPSMVTIDKFDCISLLNTSFNFRMRGPHNFICRGTQKCHNPALGNIITLCLSALCVHFQHFNIFLTNHWPTW